MKIYLGHVKKITKFILPENSDNFFSYNYKVPGSKESGLITFEKKDNVWYLKSNGTADVVESGNVISSKKISDYDFVDIKISGCKSLIRVWALPENKEEIYKLDVSKLNSLTIGSAQNNNICYRQTSLAVNQIVIKKENNEYFLRAIEDVKYSVYVNNYRVFSKKLKLGDTIFVEGLKIIWMGDFIVINNPKRLVNVVGVTAYQDVVTQNDKISPVSVQDQNVNLYSDEDYFYHTPLIREIVEDEAFEIESPPGSFLQKDALPWYLKYGSSLAMMGMTFVMVWNLVANISSNKNQLSIIPQAVMILCMLVGSLIMPKLVSNFQEKNAKKKEKIRIEKYSAYLNEKDKELNLKFKKALQIMNDNYMPVNICKNIALSTNNRYFWGREISDIDFLKVRLGIGNIEAPVKIKAPERKFSLETDELLEKTFQLADKYRILYNAPIVFSFADNNISALIYNGKNMDVQSYFYNIMVQLVTLQSGGDLKIAIFTNEENANKWEYAKFLPHCWSEDKSVRLFATNTEEDKEVSSYLEEEFKKRMEVLSKNNNDNQKEVNEYKKFDTFYLIICDDYKNTEKISIVENILENKNLNAGFSFIVITDSMKNLPSQCDIFVEVNDKDGCILKRNISTKNQKVFNVEVDNTLDMHDVSKSLLNVPLLGKEGLQVLPTSLSFLDMYNVSRIEQLNIFNRWKTNDPVTSLSAPIGVYANGEQFKLNLHEKFHGPHGLIAGSTGSGKSEFIITYILSMCINYHPYEVQFVLIDYKGGGLAGAFENRETGVRVPHLAGTITNLDTAEMNRTLVSINSELTRRQKIFNETRDTLGESTVDIYKYQKFYREGLVKEPMAHLFIISDEFAELKSQQPEFMQQLISTARIGRSLGVHLILATQKPSGVVNDQIWSNSKFKVCLKVQDRGDSMEVLKKPDAASIKEPGRFYLQVGYDDFFDKGQSGWAGAKYIPNDTIVKKLDDSINFIDNIGNVTKSAKDLVKIEKKEESKGDQLTNIVKYINDLSAKENIQTKKLWLDAIPEEIFVKNLAEKYGYTKEPYYINPIIGEYDNPSEQVQGLLTLDLVNNGNTLIVGKQGSGKENLLNTIILSTVTNHTPDEVNFYIIDCGTESLKIYNKMPHVGEIAVSDDAELINEIFKMLDEEIEYRKDLMVDYSGNYKEYIDNSGNKLPLIVTIINNYDVFLDMYGRLAEKTTNLYRDGFRYGVVFIVSSIGVNTVRGKMLQNFTKKICLKLNDDNDYRNYFGAPKGLIPAKFFGRGIAFLLDKPYEFQTAYLVKKKDINNYIREASKSYSEAYTSSAKKIPIVPELVDYNEFINENLKLSSVPIGYSLETKMPYSYDFQANPINIITTNGMNAERINFIISLVKLISHISTLEVNVIDFTETISSDTPNIKLYNNDFETNLININNSIINGKNDPTMKVFFILGIGSYKSELSPTGRQIINNLLTKINEIPNVRFILIDVSSEFKNVQVEQWYYANVNNSNGIWIGPDIGNQVIINAPNVSIEDKKMVYPLMAVSVVKGQHTFIKYMLDVKEVNTNGK